ncbi:thiol:disulfide oxidoreductase [Sphingorhabdus lutea]|uniref:Thiol:disulfide oxidoreductase n=1 Tax=Sphingorhabdus lutea TaxID=1913578 RepID=A0A1L3JAI4_9SPHN|nr:glutathione binding-like protein [Sphingorhabdus lutea]APG62129.1 thiol:disulfide oxidoreductase [Sphingorhabdus lutea]
MIDLYYAPTPNGWKISIMLEEAGLDYNIIPVNIMKGEQFAPDFLKISPNNRIPAIVDHAPNLGKEPISIFETGAILIYLAEKSGQFLPQDSAKRSDVMQWLMWQMGGFGPMLGQYGHFKLYAPEKISYAINRYHDEVLRLYGVLDRQLANHEYVAAGQYSIADMAIFPWIRTYKRQEIDLDHFPHVRRYYDMLKMRPALRRGLDVGKTWINRNPHEDAEARQKLFGIREKEQEK